MYSNVQIHTLTHPLIYIPTHNHTYMTHTYTSKHIHTDRQTQTSTHLTRINKTSQTLDLLQELKQQQTLAKKK